MIILEEIFKVNFTISFKRKKLLPRKVSISKRGGSRILNEALGFITLAHLWEEGESLR